MRGREVRDAASPIQHRVPIELGCQSCRSAPLLGRVHTRFGRFVFAFVSLWQFHPSILQSASSRNAGCTPTGVVMRCEPEARNSTAVAREIRALCYPFFFDMVAMVLPCFLIKQGEGDPTKARVFCLPETPSRPRSLTKTRAGTCAVTAAPARTASLRLPV